MTRGIKPAVRMNTNKNGDGFRPVSSGDFQKKEMNLEELANAISRNSQKKLPIDLLWESNAVEDRESVEYIKSVFRLLKAYPETVMNVCTDAQSASDAYLSQNRIGKKRKFGNE